MIARAGPDDIAPITALWNEVIRDTTITFTSADKSRDDIAALIERQPVFAARQGADWVGFATLGPFRSGDGYARTFEHAIYLNAAARGSGLGRGLMRAVEDAARAEGGHSLIAGISGENAPAVAFHAHMGFAQVGQVPEAGFKFGRYIDLILMQKRLNG
ncbi:N-acetyltransferase family protein [Gymnodinialimonas sp. 2305UL16-5]|uniref:GNAT family N-acetyltransferase n=1 Tax=Gymnodinialimonas mytili TaxID=3126503 RepID=UPI00309EB23A